MASADDASVLLWDLPTVSVETPFGDMNIQVGDMNIQDLVLVASNFGVRGENRADVNRDGIVMVILAGLVGK